MMQRGQKRYWALAFLLTIASGYYWHLRGLEQRYFDQKLDAQTLEAKRQEVAEMERKVAEAKARLEQLDKDPVEIEANVRQISGKVREGEIIFRVEDVSATQSAAQ